MFTVTVYLHLLCFGNELFSGTKRAKQGLFNEFLTLLLGL